MTNKNHLGSLKPCKNSFGCIKFHINFVKRWTNIETPIKLCLDSIASSTIHNLFHYKKVKMRTSIAFYKLKIGKIFFFKRAREFTIFIINSSEIILRLLNKKSLLSPKIFPLGRLTRIKNEDFSCETFT